MPTTFSIQTQYNKITLLFFITFCGKICQTCTTIAVGKGGTVDGSVIASHSNDGAGDSPANIRKISSQDWPDGSRRPVSGGSIPQVSHTFAYITEGYSAINEFQVGLAESTCNGMLSGNSSGILNIVDLSAISMERAESSRKAIIVMGEIAEMYGYNDNGESLLVTDPIEAFIFHVLPDSSRKSAIWVAQRIPDSHVAVVANAFTIRSVDFNDGENFLYSKNILDEATKLGWNSTKMEFDFTRIFSGKELGHKYASGRRMWIAYSILSGSHLSPFYDEFVSSAPFPPTMHVRDSKISIFDVMQVMRNRYQGTPFDMTIGTYQNSGGPFLSYDRWKTSPTNVSGNWERTIATSLSILSYVVISRSWLPPEIGGMFWFAPHAAHTSCYVPFPVGIPAEFIPKGFTQNKFDQVDRGVSFWQAARFVFNIAQLRFDKMISDISEAQNSSEQNSYSLQMLMDEDYMKYKNITRVSEKYSENAEQIVQKWWSLSDNLFLNYADGFCNSCTPRTVGYPDWWLSTVGYTEGPPPSPPVPPLS